MRNNSISKFPKKLLTTISTITLSLTLSLSLLLTPILTSPILASEVNSNQNKLSLSQKSLTSIKVSKVTLDLKKLQLNTGSTETLTPTIFPSNATNQSVTWKSNNTKIASVDLDGVITGIKNGKTIITVTTVDSKKTAKCTVTVKTSPIPKISSISDITQTINQNDDYTLPSTIEAVLSDDSKKQLPIVWNPKNVDTSKSGTFIFYGSVQGYNKSIKLTLNILEKQQTIEEVQGLLLGDWVIPSYKIELKFSNNGSLIQSYYYTTSWYSKDEIVYTVISPTEMKFDYIRWYDSSFDKWFISKDADKIFNFKVSGNELIIFNWSQYGGATFKKW